MVEMAPMTNMPKDVADIAIRITKQINDGELDPFGGKFTVGELLGMSKYLPGIDAPNPN